jgi:pentatricopeptide repeat protein
MLKINPLALALVFLRASTHHAFIPNSIPYPHVANSKSGSSTIRTFSTILAESDRDVGSLQNENNASVNVKVAGTEPEEYEFSMNEITSRILSDGKEGKNFDDDELMTLTTNAIISVLTHHSRRQTVDGAETIDKILDRLEQRLDSGENIYYKLHCGHYTIAVTAWSKSGHPDSAERATLIVNRMKERNIELNEVTYNTWMNAYVIQNNISRVEEILQEMEEKIPNEIRVKDYNVLILANARQGRAKEAEKIVKSMVDRYSSGASLVLPDLITYSMLLDAWSKSGEKGRGVRAETILDSVEERQISFDTTAYNNPESTISGTYVAAMRAIIHSGEDNIVERVENIYKRALVRNITPDAYVYATLLDAYATTRADASEKVSEILAMMEENVADMSSGGITVVYNTALKLLKESREKNAVAKAEELFEKMKSQLIFDEVTYGTMIALYTNKGSRSSAKRAEELLAELINDKGLEANTHHMNSAMLSLLREGSISKAADLLDKMEEEYRNGSEFMKPNVVSYSTLMSGWVKSNDPQKLEQTTMVFDKMMTMFKSGNKDAEPNFVSYVTLVDCIVKSGEVGAAERAEKIVRNMYESYKLGKSNFKPNAQLVSTVIDSWSKSGDNSAGERAETLLNWLFEMYEAEKDPQLMPTAYPFTSCKSKAWRIGEMIK